MVNIPINNEFYLYSEEKKVFLGYSSACFYKTKFFRDAHFFDTEAEAFSVKNRYYPDLKVFKIVGYQFNEIEESPKKL